MLTNWGAALRRWRRRFSRSEWIVNRLRLPRTEAPAHAPGLLLVQIDGLSRRQLEIALGKGRMPFLARLLEHNGCELRTFYSGLPASTPAVQAELYYGVRTAVPGWGFLDPDGKSIGSMISAERARRIESGMTAGGAVGLLQGGSSWSNIYTGGATQAESHFCSASLGVGDMWRTGKLRNILLFSFLHLPSVLRLLVLVPLEIVIAIRDAVRGLIDGRSRREITFILARVFVAIGLRELVTLGVKIDLARGLPVIHVNFLGYDEHAHRRGPDSAFARWTLRGIDRAIRLLHVAARRSEGRDYETWIFSDHGQVRTTPFERLCKGGLEGLVRRHWPDAVAENVAATVAANASSQAVGTRSTADAARAARFAARAGLDLFGTDAFAVAGFGPVGHIYYKSALSGDQETGLIRALLAGGVPGVLRCVSGDAQAVEWHEPGGAVHLLPADTTLVRGPEELRPVIAVDLAALARHPHAGDLVALGWHPDPLRQPVSFAWENGAHCGPSPDEVQGFLILPPASNHLVDSGIVRPAALRDAALRHLGRTPHTPHRRRLPPPSARHLRVVTYNVHYCKGTDGRFAPARIARVLRDLDPDIVALQELESGRLRSRHEDQLAWLAGELGLHFAFCPSIERGDERYGHAILAREPVVATHRIRLPDGGRPRIEPRDALAARVSLAGRELAVVGTHLGLATPERVAQIDRLLAPDWLGGIGDGQPAIFLGDLNLAPGGALYRRLVSPWRAVNGAAVFRDVQAHAPLHVACRTFPSFFPVRRLDHIFVTRHFDVVRVDAPSNQLTRRASDHLPLVADLVLHD
ncbi:endonuclease [Opitutaceae bacterium TAV5]|nr:endonuclease [Opitutaceae bacterium TAV5]